MRLVPRVLQWVLGALAVTSCAPGDASRCNTDLDCQQGEICYGGACGLVVPGEVGATRTPTGDDRLRTPAPSDEDDEGVEERELEQDGAGVADGEGEGEGEGAGEGEGEGDGTGEGEGEGDSEPVVEPPPATFERWGINEPDDRSGARDCLALTVTSSMGRNRPGDWTDEACSAALPFVCDVPSLADVEGCTTVEIGGRARALCASSATRYAAALSCASAGGSLTRVDGEQENQALTAALAQEGSFLLAWLGATDLDVEGDWRWPDRARVRAPFSNWATERPNGGEADTCMVLRLAEGTGPVAPEEWDDRNCGDPNPFVCDVPEDTTMPDCVERVVGQKRRFFCATPVSAGTARNACALAGGSLARVDSASENTALVSEGAPLVAADVWIGGRDDDVEGAWAWPDGDLFDELN